MRWVSKLRATRLPIVIWQLCCTPVTYLVRSTNNFMEQIRSLEANSSPPSQEMCRRLWSSKVPWRGHKCTCAQPYY